MKCLITGGSSLLAKALYETKPPELTIESTYCSNPIPDITNYHLNIRDKRQVNEVCNKIKPDVIIHAAAIGSVDYAERHFREAYDVNVMGTIYVAEAAQRLKAKLVYISTNAVYSGKNPPYNEKARRIPINRYGKLKCQAERYIEHKENWIIIRPYMLYGWPYLNGRQNWLTIILNKFRNNEPIKLVNDIFWQPTLVTDCAQGIWNIISKDQIRQHYNIAAPDVMSLYEFGLAVQECFGLKGIITPISSKSLMGLARRPEATLFDTRKTFKMGIRLQTVQRGLELLKCTQFQPAAL